ncbi:unnamed protein product [Closterium sp. NIES-54]
MSPCWLSCRPALSVASPCWPSHRPAAHAPHCWQPHNPALPARRPALPALSRPTVRTTLLRAALLPVHRPAGSRTAACTALTARHPAGRRPAARAPPSPPYLRAALLVAPHPALHAMASLSVLTFDHEGPSLAPPATADSATRSQWLTHDAAARLPVRNHLPLAERAHFGQHKTAKSMYDAVVALEDLVTHLCSESSLPGIAPAKALHTFTLDSGASRCFFRDNTTLTPLPPPVPVRLADPSGGPVLARSSTVLPCPAVPYGSLSGLHLPLFSTNLVSTAALQDAMVTTTTPMGQHVSICTCTQTGRHLATFTRRPRSSLYTLTAEPPQVAASAQVSVSGPVAAPCSCHLLTHQTLLWHHRLGHPSLPRLCGMHSRLLVFGIPSKGKVPDVLIRSIRAVHLQLRERFREDLRLLRLHSDRGGEFSSDLLRDFCRGEGILHSFTLPASPQQNGVAECRIGLVMEVARTSIPIFCGCLRSGTLRISSTSGPDVTFEELVPFYRLFPYGSAPLPTPPLFLALGPPLVDPLPPLAPAPSSVSHGDPLPLVVPVEGVVDSGAA